MPEKQTKRKHDPCPKIAIGTEDSRISLKEAFEASPLILIFYSGDFSPQAITQLRRFAKEHEKYSNAGFQLFAVGNGSEATRAAFIKKYNIPFSCFHDRRKSAAKAFGVVKKAGNKLVIVPHVFVINTEGKICYVKKGYPKRTEILKACK